MDIEGVPGWAHNNLALVLGRDGRGGSGLALLTQDGEFAVLTAQHVVVAAALSGEITVGIPNNGNGSFRSHLGTSFRSHPRLDLALVILGSPAWSSERANAPTLTQDLLGSVEQGNSATHVGAPGQFKTGIAADQRSIERLRMVSFQTEVSHEGGGLPFSRVTRDDQNAHQPSSFAGMSGGPVFRDDALVGTTIVQTANGLGGSVDSLGFARLELWPSLFKRDWTPPGEDGVNYMGMKVGHSADWLLTLNKQPFAARLTSLGEVLYPADGVDAAHRAVGVLDCIIIDRRNLGGDACPLNVRTSFFINSLDDKTIREAFTAEIASVLGHYNPQILST